MKRGIPMTTQRLAELVDEWVRAIWQLMLFEGAARYIPPGDRRYWLYRTDWRYGRDWITPYEPPSKIVFGRD